MSHCFSYIRKAVIRGSFPWVSSENQQTHLCEGQQQPSPGPTLCLNWQKRLSLLSCCLSVGAPNLAASWQSRMKCPIKGYNAGQADTPVSSQLFAILCPCVLIHVCPSLFWQQHWPFIQIQKFSGSFHLPVHPAIWSSPSFNERSTSRIIVCRYAVVLIRPDQWRYALTSKIMTHLHSTI